MQNLWQQVLGVRILAAVLSGSTNVNYFNDAETKFQLFVPRKETLPVPLQKDLKLEILNCKFDAGCGFVVFGIGIYIWEKLDENL